jgi:nitroreductase
MATDAIRAIMERRSIRSYQSKPVPEKDLRTILEAGRQAPSAANRQPWHFVVVRDQENKGKLAAACAKQTWLADAGAIIAGVGRPSVSENWYSVDVAIAMENMVIAAAALGYGTCWIGAFDQAQVKGLLRVPEDCVVVALIPLGIPADSPEARPRMPMAEFASAERFGEELE